MATKGKDRAAMFTATEQRLLLETYEEFKDVITKKGNTAAINKAREKGWQEIADRLNANLSEGKRTWQQVKIKYKNIVQNATKKKTEVAGTGGGPPPASFTPAEELALEINKGRPVLEGIEGGTSSKMISRSIRSEYIKDSVCCMDPPDIMLPVSMRPFKKTCKLMILTEFNQWSQGEVMGVEEDEETVSVCSRRPEDADTVLEPSQSGTTCDKNPENIKGVYKRYLLKQMEAIDIDIQYKKLKMRKLELEIQQLQKNASRTTIFKKGKGKKKKTFLITFHNIYLCVFTPNRQIHSE
ncbi:uncharacterized protein LOC128018666 isoform X2 [Carassius gibelio]|uniref:uncharacterized protein LOC128018666 isoform X2 n=1 Tax=Carassius gibelio TaxID=101364 RepID=UPI002278D7EB|nr:uncharacterized protein LOC128018666 isoform X2 [Carassius gibelio]